MEINLREIPIREVFNGYLNNDEDGVVGYGGKLNIRPKYQREFVYKDKQRDAVIDTIQKGLPLNVMYWVRNEDDTYEVLDGQQRTISICQFLSGEFSMNYRYQHNLTKDELDQILDYKLMIYVCEGTDKEKLDWFKIINIAGEKLTAQELRNAIYTGEWLTDAKRYFSKTNCAAYNFAKEYMKGSPIRQDYLQTAISWIAHRDKVDIEEYMAIKQKEKDASDLWMYFQNVINWVKVIFPNYRKEMKGIDWGILYNEYKDKPYNNNTLEMQTKELLLDDDVTNKKGIYSYLITEEEKHLSIRAFSNKMKREAFERQNGHCVRCNNVFDIDDMEGDHIEPWSQGGKTISNNCQMLCISCNRAKSNH